MSARLLHGVLGPVAVDGFFPPYKHPAEWILMHRMRRAVRWPVAAPTTVQAASGERISNILAVMLCPATTGRGEPDEPSDQHTCIVARSLATRNPRVTVPRLTPVAPDHEAALGEPPLDAASCPGLGEALPSSIIPDSS